MINNDSIQNIKHNNHSNNINDNNLKENKSIDDLISTLKEEINFLRNEVVSKDKIIELMIKDKFNVVSTEKNVNLVGKSSVTNLESRDKTDVIINDKNDKKKRGC